MPTEPATALEKLYEAVLVLASEEGKIERRLSLAYFDHLQAISVAALPVTIRDEWQSICDELKQMYTSRDVASAIDQSKAVDLAQRILLVYDP